MKRLANIALPGLLLCHLGAGSPLSAMDRNSSNSPLSSAALSPVAQSYQQPLFGQRAFSSAPAANLPGPAFLMEDACQTMSPVHTLHAAGSPDSSIELVGSGFARRWGTMYITTPAGTALMSLVSDNLLSVSLPDPVPKFFTLWCGNQCMTFEVAQATPYHSLSQLLRPTGSSQSQDLLTHLRAAFSAGPPVGSPDGSQSASRPFLASVGRSSAITLADSLGPTSFRPVSTMTLPDSAFSAPMRAASAMTLPDSAPSASTTAASAMTLPDCAPLAPTTAASAMTLPDSAPLAPTTAASAMSLAAPAASLSVVPPTPSPSPEATRPASALPPVKQPRAYKKRSHTAFLPKATAGASLTNLVDAAFADLESEQAKKRRATEAPAAAAEVQDEPVGLKVGGIVQPDGSPHLVQLLGSGFEAYEAGGLNIRVDGKVARHAIKSDNLMLITLPADTPNRLVEVELDGQVRSTLNIEDGVMPYGQLTDLDVYGTFGLSAAQWASLRADLKRVAEEHE